MSVPIAQTSLNRLGFVRRHLNGSEAIRSRNIIHHFHMNIIRRSYENDMTKTIRCENRAEQAENGACERNTFAARDGSPVSADGCSATVCGLKPGPGSLRIAEKRTGRRTNGFALPRPIRHPAQRIRRVRDPGETPTPVRPDYRYRNDLPSLSKRCSFSGTAVRRMVVPLSIL